MEPDQVQNKEVGGEPIGGQAHAIWIGCSVCLPTVGAEGLSVQSPAAKAGYWDMGHYLSGGEGA